MDMKLPSMNFDPHALNQSSFYGLNGATETWHVASVGGDVEIVLRHARGVDRRRGGEHRGVSERGVRLLANARVVSVET